MAGVADDSLGHGGRVIRHEDESIGKCTLWGADFGLVHDAW